MDEIYIVASHGSLEVVRYRFYHRRWLHRQKWGIGAAWLELGDGGRKEWWGFKSARVPVLRLRRHLEKSPKREYDTEKGNDSGCCPISGVLLLWHLSLTFFFPWIQNNLRNQNVSTPSWLRRSKLHLDYAHFLICVMPFLGVHEAGSTGTDAQRFDRRHLPHKPEYMGTTIEYKLSRSRTD